MNYEPLSTDECLVENKRERIYPLLESRNPGWNRGTIGKLVAVHYLETIKLHAHASPGPFARDAHEVARAPQRGQLAIHRIRHVQQNIDYRAYANGMFCFEKDADIRDVFRL